MSFIKRGIVIQNDDPEAVGRVKVFFPEVSPALYAGWRDLESDIQFKFPGLNLKSDLAPVMDALKKILPWAEQASAGMGGSASGRFHASKNHGTVSDSPNDFTISNSPIINTSGLDEKSGLRLEINPPVDAFGGQNDTFKSNPLSGAYQHSVYSNAAKGNFDIPSVGAHVWAFFENDDPNFPVIFASSHGKEEWQSIYGEDGSDAPGDFENNSVPDLKKLRFFRHKHVISEKGGIIEFINTDGKESVSITHVSGSSVAITNEGTSLFSHKNGTDLFLGDHFHTVRGDCLSYTNGVREVTTENNSIERVGKWASAQTAVTNWMTSAKTIGRIKQLFEITRSPAGDFTSPQQSKLGQHAPHPLTSGIGLKGTRSSLTQIFPNVVGVHSLVGSVYVMGSAMPITPVKTPSSYIGRFSPSTKDGSFGAESKKKQLGQLCEQLFSTFRASEIAMGEGGSKVQKVTKDKVEIVGAGVNDLPAIRVDSVGNLHIVGVEITLDGAFPKYATSALIEKVHVDKTPFGNKTTIVGSRYEITTGSGGYYVSSTGIMDFITPMLNLTALETNLFAKENLNIQTKTFYTKAESIAFSGAMGLDGNLGVTQNLSVMGAGYFDGGVFTNKINAPAQWEETAPIILFGKMKQGFVIGIDSQGGNVTSSDCDMCIEIYPHTMAYKIPATNFFMSSKTMATAASVLNGDSPVSATPIINGPKIPT